jgi:hypothetical protein
MCHRIREVMSDPKPPPLGGELGGEGKVIEADEAYYPESLILRGSGLTDRPG